MKKKKDKNIESVVNPVINASGDIVLSDKDFASLLEFEKIIKAIEEQLDKTSGNIFRLQKEQEALFAHSRKVAEDVINKRKEVSDIYKLNDKLHWKIDINTKKIIYPR